MKICGLKLADIGLKLKNTFKYVVCGFGLVFFTFTISYGLEVALLSSTWATASGCWVPESTMESVREFFFKHYYLIEAVMKFEEIFLDVDGTIWNTTEIIAQAWNKAIDEVFPQVPHVTADILKGQFGKTMYVIGNNLFLPSGRQTAAFFLKNAASASRMP